MDLYFNTQGCLSGICLSPLYDRAYDKGYISISEKYEVLISTDLKKKSKEKFYSKHFGNIAGSKIHLPKKYLPKKEFLQFHLDEVFRK